MIGNQITIRGNVVKEPTMFPEKKFGIIRMASNYSDKRDGQKTMYFDVKIFGDRIGDVEYFQPVVGDRLSVTGSLALDEYEKGGVKRNEMVIYCDHFEKIWRRPTEKPVEKPAESPKADF